jgi:signal transduction histidine kinase
VTDDGKGIDAELLERNAEGDQKLFMENVTTKKISGQNFGYGCYIAYDLATTRCGWKMFAENLPGRGCRFVIIIKN